MTQEHTSQAHGGTQPTSTIITAENIERESYYNLIQLCKITGYADPIAALKSKKAQGHTEAFSVSRDSSGNITGGTGYVFIGKGAH